VQLNAGTVIVEGPLELWAGPSRRQVPPKHA